jgi:hypothetical protein
MGETNAVDFFDGIPETFPGPNILTMGPSGTGKTYQLATLCKLGFQVHVLFTENGLETLLGYFADKGEPVPENLYWQIVEPPKASITQLIRGAEKVNSMTYEALSKMQDPDRMKHNGFINMLEALNGFTDARTGKTFPPYNEWTNRSILAIDSLSGINTAAMSLVVGSKPAKSQSDWGMAQDQILKFLDLTTQACIAPFVLTAHVEREQDMVLGGVKLMVSTLGRALAPQIPAKFSDVILTMREGDEWNWSTAASNADLKTRNLPIADKIEPGFEQIMLKWRERALASVAAQA